MALSRSLVPLAVLALAGVALSQESSPGEARREGIRELEDLEPDFPVRMEDARVLRYRVREIQLLSRYERTRDARDRGLVDARFVYGLAPRLQVLAGLPYGFGSADRRAGGFASGAAVIEALYNLGPERRGLPAFALGLGETFPGTFGTGYETAIKLVATRSIGVLEHQQRVHANLEVLLPSAPGEEARRSRIGAVVGYDHVFDPRTLGLVDLAYEQEPERGADGTIFEFGLRRRAGATSLLGLGVGFGVGGGAPRQRVTLGFQVSF